MSKLLRNLGLGALIVGIPVAGAFYRCHAVRHMDGHPEASRIEETGRGTVLRLHDQVCTGDSSQGSDGVDCDLRTITVSLPDGARLDTSMGEGFVAHRESCSGRPRAELGGVTYELAGTPARLVPAGAPPLAESATGVKMATFASPAIVTTVDGDAIVVDEGRHVLTVARVRRDGSAAWRRYLPGVCHLLRAYPDVLVIATTEPSHRAVGVELATGTLRWRVRP